MTAAEPEIAKGKKFTAIWIIPVIAVAIGAWMVAWTYMTEGPEIRVTFETAKGLAEGKTVVKFRDVEVGQVQEVLLNDDMQSVTAVIKMRREAEPMLTEDTLFWIVTAQIGGGGISGLETILTGAYIELSPGLSKIASRNFIGLKTPPLTPADAPGIRLILVTEHRSSITTGDPVLYHGFQVGRVESLTFDPESRRIRNEIFIDAPYHAMITSTTRFWDVSGISISAGADGLKISTGSMESILRGGVTFSVPPGLNPGVPVDNNTEFRLFPTFDEILESPHQQRGYYVVGFEQSVRGLLPGAPVEYRGIEVGAVERIMMEELVNKGLREDTEPQGLPIPVLIYIEPASFALPDTKESLDLMEQTFREGVENGLRATLGQGNLLTGAQIVNLDYYDDTPDAKLGEFEGYTTVPTVVTGLSGLEAKISRLLDKANALPLDKTVVSVNLAVAELNQTLKAVHGILENESLHTIPGELQSTLEALRVILENKGIREIPEEVKSTLEAARFQLKGESAEAYQLTKTLKEVESAARALREFLDYLERKPESLLRGKSDTDQ